MKCTQEQNRTEKDRNMRTERQRKKIDIKTQIETGKGERKRHIC